MLRENEINAKIQEIINFYTDDDEISKHETKKYLNLILHELNDGEYAYIYDEILLEHEGHCVGHLNKFAIDLHKQIIEDVCNVIRSFRVKEEKDDDIIDHERSHKILQSCINELRNMTKEEFDKREGDLKIEVEDNKEIIPYSYKDHLDILETAASSGNEFLQDNSISISALQQKLFDFAVELEDAVKNDRNNEIAQELYELADAKIKEK